MYIEVGGLELRGRLRKTLGEVFESDMKYMNLANDSL